MKVLIACNSASGLYLFRKEVVEALKKNNEVIISSPYEEEMDYFVDLGCKYINLEFNRHGTNPIKELGMINYYKKMLKKEAPDIVFTYTIKPNSYCGMAAGFLGIPCVANITGLGSAIENGGLLQILSLILYKLGLRKNQKVFFQNKSNQEFMVSKKIVTVPYDLLPGSGVNLNNYVLLPYENKETIDFVFVGRVMKEKGIDQYLECAKVITAKYPNTRFHVCGELEEDYEAILNEYENKRIIIYHGNVRNMKEIYKQISCTIHPTYYPEGLSNVLLESCASGIPIITTDRSGCVEVVEDGVNGFVVKQKDAVDLIKKVEKFINLKFEEKKQMGLNGREKVEKEFDRQIVIDKYLKELECVS